MATVGNLVCGNRPHQIWISRWFSSHSFVVPSHPRPSRPEVAYQFPWSQPTPSHVLSLTPLSCRFDLGPLYCFPAIAGQCPYPIKHIYHLAFAPAWNPRAPALHLWLRFAQSASDSRDRNILPHNRLTYTLLPASPLSCPSQQHPRGPALPSSSFLT